MKKTKVTAIIAATILTILSLTGCGNDNVAVAADTTTESVTESSIETTVTTEETTVAEAEVTTETVEEVINPVEDKKTVDNAWVFLINGGTDQEDVDIIKEEATRIIAGKRSQVKISKKMQGVTDLAGITGYESLVLKPSLTIEDCKKQLTSMIEAALDNNMVEWNLEIAQSTDENNNVCFMLNLYYLNAEDDAIYGVELPTTETSVPDNIDEITEETTDTNEGEIIETTASETEAINTLEVLQ